MPFPGAAASPRPPLPRLLVPLVLAALVLLGGRPAAVGGRPAAADPPLHAGQPYAQARLSLLQAGWSPRSRSPRVACASLGPDRRCALYPELQSCSQTGPGFCRFEWTSPAGDPLAVITRGGDSRGDPGVLSTWFALR